MKIFLICNVKSKYNLSTRLELFESELKLRNLDFEVLDPLNFDEISFDFNLDYKVLRLSADILSLKLDALLRKKHDLDITSFLHRGVFESMLNLDSLNFIKTIDFVATERDHLQKQVDYLGGFPLVLKENSASRGVGVIKVDSMHGLFSKLDFLRANGFYDLQLKQYFEHKYQYRVMIAFGKLIGSIRITTLDEEFRSNVAINKRVKEKILIDLDPKILNDCMKYFKLRGADFIGIDVLVNQNGDYCLIEGNAPCDFLLMNRLTGGMVPALIIDAMLENKL